MIFASIESASATSPLFLGLYLSLFLKCGDLLVENRDFFPTAFLFYSGFVVVWKAWSRCWSK